MNRHWLVQLGDISSTVMGQAPPGTSCNKEGRGTIFVKAGEFGDREPVVREWTTKPLKMSRRGDVLVCVVGATAGKINLAIDSAIGRSVAAVRPDANRLDTNYLHHFLATKVGDLRANSQGLAQGVITKEMLANLTLQLPSLDEQRRIAAILDKADALRQKRKRAIALLDSLTPSLFLEMFGGDIARPTPLGEVAKIASGSTPPRGDIDNFGGTIPWVKTTEVKGGTILATEERVTDRGVIAARLKTFLPGTILMAMYGQGTTRGNVALLGIPATINQACAAITPSSRLLSEFLFVQLSLKYDEIRSMGRGGNQPNLNLDLVGKIGVLVPPLAEQRQFISKLTNVNKRRSLQLLQLSKLEDSFSSLQHRAFSGQL